MELTLRERLKALREERGLSQRELAERAGVHVGSIHQWESGRRRRIRVPQATAVARALDVPLTALLGEACNGAARTPAMVRARATAGYPADINRALYLELISHAVRQLPSGQPVTLREFREAVDRNIDAFVEQQLSAHHHGGCPRDDALPIRPFLRAGGAVAQA